MSYPWWRFKVKFTDGYSTEVSATGVTVSHAMQELLEAFHSWESENEDTPYIILRTHKDIRSVEYLHCDTFGIDDESDKILLAGGC